MSSKLLSTQCLIMNLMSFFMLIGQVYLAIDLTFSSGIQIHWLQNVGGIIYALNSVLIMWIFNGQSEDIKQSITEIQANITKLEVRAGSVMLSFDNFFQLHYKLSNCEINRSPCFS